MTTYHHGVDARVDEGKHPDGSRHVADTGPHAEHGTSVVVSLQSGAALALHDDDDGVESPSPGPRTDSRSALPMKNRRWRRLRIVKCAETSSPIFFSGKVNL